MRDKQQTKCTQYSLPCCMVDFWPQGAVWKAFLSLTCSWSWPAEVSLVRDGNFLSYRLLLSGRFLLLNNFCRVASFTRHSTYWRSVPTSILQIWGQLPLSLYPVYFTILIDLLNSSLFISHLPFLICDSRVGRNLLLLSY